MSLGMNRRLAPVLCALGVALSSAALISACSPASAPVQDSTVSTDQNASTDAFPPGPYADRDPALAKQLVTAGALLLDVRTPGEFESGHVEGAVNIDHGEVPARMEEIRELVGGDLHKPVVLYCKSGRRAGIVKTQLEAEGFDRVTNLGGFVDWPG